MHTIKSLADRITDHILYSTIRFANGTNNSCRTALAELELQLEALGLIAPSPERPSERAMRLASQTKEWKQTDNDNT